MLHSVARWQRYKKTSVAQAGAKFRSWSANFLFFFFGLKIGASQDPKWWDLAQAAAKCDFPPHDLAVVCWAFTEVRSHDTGRHVAQLAIQRLQEQSTTELTRWLKRSFYKWLTVHTQSCTHTHMLYNYRPMLCFFSFFGMLIKSRHKS